MPLRLGIIGCGNVLGAYRLAADELRLRGWVEVIVLCGREGQRDRAKQEFPNARFTTKAEEVLHSPDVDVVVVLTSMSEHARLADQGLRAGKHVLVEKPLATSLEEAAQLVRLAQQSQGYLMCAPFTALSPTFQIMARRIRLGDIGKPYSARARYGWAGPWWNEWFYTSNGGCIFDLGVYCLTSLTGLIGSAQRVVAMSTVAIPEREVNGRKVKVNSEDNAQILLEFENGALGVVTTGFTLQQYRSPAIEIYGGSGTIQMLGDDWDPDGYELWQNPVGAWQLFKETHPNWLWTDGLRHLIECIRAGTRPIVTPEHAFHVLEIMIKARESSRTGCALSVSSRFAPIAITGEQSHEAAHLVHDRTR